MERDGQAGTLLRLGVPDVDAPAVAAALARPSVAIASRSWCLLESSTAGRVSGSDHPLLDAGITVRTAGFGWPIPFYVRSRLRDRAPTEASAVSPPFEFWWIRSEWSIGRPRPEPVLLGAGRLERRADARGLLAGLAEVLGLRLIGDLAGGAPAWADPVAMPAVLERTWALHLDGLDLVVRRWTPTPTPTPTPTRTPPAGPGGGQPDPGGFDLIQLEHFSPEADAGFVVPVLRALGARLGIDAGLATEHLEARAVRRLSTWT